MDTLTRLNDLVGKVGLLKIPRSEVKFTFLSVDPAPGFPTEVDDDAFQTAISQSSFEVRFDEGILIDGKNTKVISGRYVSRIF
jgi:hypothetical protein